MLAEPPAPPAYNRCPTMKSWTTGVYIESVTHKSEVNFVYTGIEFLLQDC